MKKKTRPNPQRQNSKARSRTTNARSNRRAAPSKASRQFLCKIKVTLRPSILDPQGKAVEHAIGSLNVGTISGVRMGKYIELKIEAKDKSSARATTEEVCRKLLANPVMEDYQFALEPA